MLSFKHPTFAHKTLEMFFNQFLGEKKRKSYILWNMVILYRNHQKRMFVIHNVKFYQTEFTYVLILFFLDTHSLTRLNYFNALQKRCYLRDQIKIFHCATVSTLSYLFWRVRHFELSGDQIEKYDVEHCWSLLSRPGVCRIE